MGKSNSADLGFGFTRTLRAVRAAMRQHAALGLRPALRFVWRSVRHKRDRWRLHDRVGPQVVAGLRRMSGR
jgi:hypothetical protein